MTAVAYFYAGLFTMQSALLMPYILPSIVIGVPIGAWLIRQIRPETFRRVCMSFDAWVVAFGLSNLQKELHLVQSNWAFLLMFAVGVLDAALLYYFFTVQLPRVKREADEAAVMSPSSDSFVPTLVSPSAQRT
jgi:ABC-type spermidine/putrescine transport system permease subunit II